MRSGLKRAGVTSKLMVSVEPAPLLAVMSAPRMLSMAVVSSQKALMAVYELQAPCLVETTQSVSATSLPEEDGIFGQATLDSGILLKSAGQSATDSRMFRI